MIVVNLQARAASNLGSDLEEDASTKAKQFQVVAFGFAVIIGRGTFPPQPLVVCPGERRRTTPDSDSANGKNLSYIYTTLTVLA